MEVKNVIQRALGLIDRTDLAEKLSTNSTLAEDEDYIVKTMLICMNSVVDELARCYFPLRRTEEFEASNGIILLDDFSKVVVRIHSVKCNGKLVDFKVFPEYIKTDCSGDMVVEYDFSPDKCRIGVFSDIGETPIGESVTAYGIASEYCLICGRVPEAEMWDKKYRECIENTSKCYYGNGKSRLSPPSSPTGFLPKRSWV